jgi:PAS domain S-box-containing protein
MPHIHCNLGKLSLVWTMAVTDTVIGLAYVAISLTLWALVKKVRIQFSTVVLCFGVFIAACGGTHFMEVYTLWTPHYWIAASIKVITAIASVGTGIYLVQLRHPIVTVAEAAKLSEQRRLDLEALTSALETRVAERTEDLLKSQQQLALITDSVPALIAYIDSERRYRFVNASYGTWFDRKRDEITGKHMRDLLGETQFQTIAPHINEALSGQPVNFEMEVTFPKAGKRTLQVDYIPDQPSRGAVRGFFLLAIDITENKRKEQALQDALRSRDEFISIASHELKTPVTSMSMRMQMMERTFQTMGISAFTQEDCERTVRLASRQLNRLTHLIEDMLDISTISTGQLSIEKSEFDLDSLIAEVVHRFQKSSGEAGLKVKMNLEPNIKGIWDRNRMEQVIESLLSNAIKYAPGSPIDITLKSRPDGRIHLTIQDYGPGIARDEQERIFERFERATPHTSVSGLGLGLFIVKEIIRLHGGDIWVESKTGHGAKFAIELPTHIKRQDAS